MKGDSIPCVARGRLGRVGLLTAASKSGGRAESVGGEGVSQKVTDLQVLEHQGQTLPEESEDMSDTGPWVLALETVTGSPTNSLQLHQILLLS